MYYYKNKVKPILILCIVVIVMSISICVCLWDDTSIQKLKVDGGAATGDYVGKKPGLAGLVLGERLTIDGIGYTVGHKGTDMITVYSDNVKDKGLTSRYDQYYNNYYTGSEVFSSVETYYNILKYKPIIVGSTTYGMVSEHVVGHKDYSWNLWLPSVREMNLYGSNGHTQASTNIELEGLIQPVMEWYNTDDRRKDYIENYYWLRSTVSGFFSSAFGVYSGGSLFENVVFYDWGVVRVALNLKIS